MIAAASALPLLLIAQLAHVYFQYDVTLGGALIFVDRAVYVGSLILYSAWLGGVAPINSGVLRGLAAVAAVAFLAIVLPRLYAIPIIWALQVAILAGLALWAHAERRNGWSCGFLLVAVMAQAIGALTIMPLCQLGASPEWLAMPQAQYVCSVVIGPTLAALLPAGLGAAGWMTLMATALVRRRV